MAMLAEPRRKLKVVNLRGNSAWSKDSNKFGQRLLERMGWAPGKGLGAREDGVTAHVVARYKNDDHGLGYNDRSDQWTQHEDSFESLLAGLRSEAPVEPPEHVPSSLEQKSKKSRARVHYHKFTRGKDLSRYSEKDLANIFGKKSLKNREIKSKKYTIQQIDSADEIPPKSEDKQLEMNQQKQPQQVFTCGGNMADYFTSKLRALGRSELANTGSSLFEVKEQMTLQDLAQKEYDQDNQDDLTRKKKKKKNRMPGENFQNSVDVDCQGEVVETENYDDIIFNKKGKNKCNTEKYFVNSTTRPSAFEANEQITLQDFTQKECIENTLHDLTHKKKKKKNRKEGEKIFHNSLDGVSQQEVVKRENYDEIITKKKRKKKCDMEKHFQNLIKDEFDLIDCGDVKYKKKKKKTKHLENFISCVDNVEQDEPTNTILNIDCQSHTTSEPLYSERSAKKKKVDQ